MHNDLDFAKVEALRKHMMLRRSDMAELLGVSRMTYHRWVLGNRAPEHKSIEKVRLTLKNLLTIMVEDKWPSPEVIILDSNSRRDKLNEALSRFN
jgi:DNA-binding XRE family transcriptional regulator